MRHEAAEFICDQWLRSILYQLLAARAQQHEKQASNSGARTPFRRSSVITRWGDCMMSVSISWGMVNRTHTFRDQYVCGWTHRVVMSATLSKHVATSFRSLSDMPQPFRDLRRAWTRAPRHTWLGKGNIGAVVNRHRGWLSAYIGVNVFIITPL